MKAQKFVLSAVALGVAVGGAFAFKAKKIANLQLFTKVTSGCHHISLWTRQFSSVPAPNNVYTTSGCNNLYSGNVTAQGD